MDWRRARLIFIGAFLCLDLLLAWQVRQLLPVSTQLPTVPGSAVAAADTATHVLPPLSLQTQNPSVPSVLHALGLHQANCIASTPTRGGPVTHVTCQGNDGAQMQTFSGLFLYSVPWPGVGLDQALPIWQQIAASELASMPGADLTLPLTAGAVSPGTQSRVFYATERDTGGDVLFNGGMEITLDGSQHTIVVDRIWLQDVTPSNQPARPTISQRQAEIDAEQIFGPNAVSSALAPPVEGYYSPNTEPPGITWTVYPVWQIRTAQGQCYYINAYNGQVVSKEGAQALDPQSCFAVSS